MVERKGHGTMLIDPGDVICIFMCACASISGKKTKKEKEQEKKNS